MFYWSIALSISWPSILSHSQNFLTAVLHSVSWTTARLCVGSYRSRMLRGTDEVSVVSGFTQLSLTPLLSLCKSFRCSPARFWATLLARWPLNPISPAAHFLPCKPALVSDAGTEVTRFIPVTRIRLHPHTGPWCSIQAALHRSVNESLLSLGFTTSPSSQRQKEQED